MPEPRPKTPAEAAADKLWSAMIRCENQTKAQLADPDGFDPVPYGQWLAVETAEDRHVFVFKARARNGYGALIWAEFECTAVFDDGSWSAVIAQI